MDISHRVLPAAATMSMRRAHAQPATIEIGVLTGLPGAAQAKASGAAVVERMKAMPMADDRFGQGSIRADRRKLHPAFLFEAKQPGESKTAWDVMRLVATTPADQAFRPLSAGRCASVHA